MVILSTFDNTGMKGGSRAPIRYDVERERFLAQSILDGILAVPRFRQKHSATAEKPRIAMRRSVSTVLINLRIQSALILQNAWIRGSNELLPNYEISVEPNGVQNGRCRCD